MTDRVPKTVKLHLIIVYFTGIKLLKIRGIEEVLRTLEKSERLLKTS